MIRFLIRLAIYVGTAALAFFVASWLLDGFVLSASGFIVAIGVFAVAQSILTPFIVTMASRYAPAVLGGIGLISTFIALLLASFVPDGITLSGIDTWVLASLIVWLITALGGWVLPLIFLRGKFSDSKTREQRAA
jgi:uncharacterized membrane protein YvlD (DUF360 family)